MRNYLHRVLGIPPLVSIRDRMAPIGQFLADLNNLRRAIQAISFGFLAFLIVQTAYPLELPVPADLYLRFDPLIAMVSFITGKAFVWKMAPALILLALIIIFGNFFCGWLCPLGSAIDLSDYLLFRRAKRSAANPIPTSKSKHYILVVVLVASLFSVQFLFLMDPISLITRTLVVVFFPSSVYMINAASAKFQALFPGNGWVNVDLAQPVFKLNLLILAFFALILILGAIHRRFWCRYLCPLGSLLSLSNRFRLFQRFVAKACNDCGRCQKACPMGAVSADPRNYNADDCILCLRCMDCPPEAVTFSPLVPALSRSRGLNLSRRYFMGSTAMGLFLAVAFKANPLQASSAKLNQRLIRPPGSVPEDRFVSLCIGCGECLKVCPNNALQATFLEAGLSGIYTPRLVSRIGYCEQYCNLCGKVCPTAAIREVTVEEKQKIQIGLARIDKTRCMRWADNILCLVCNEQCSYQAIDLDEEKRPVVNKEKCVGCGICENKCPVIGEAAIIVYSLGPEQGRLPERRANG